MSLVTLSVGGSIIVPDEVDYTFLAEFKAAISKYLEEDKERKLILVSGGGALARRYQEAFRKICSSNTDEEDWLGIKATHLNGTLLKSIFSEYVEDDLVVDPSANIPFKGRVLVAGGWKPGFSTDTDAVYLSKKFGGKLVVNLSNIAKVYTDDPKKNPDAKPIDEISWKEFRKIVGDVWTPGKNTPFDPIASKEAEKEGMKVICASGRDIENLMNILEGREFIGTTIG